MPAIKTGTTNQPTIRQYHENAITHTFFCFYNSLCPSVHRSLTFSILASTSVMEVCTDNFYRIYEMFVYGFDTSFDFFCLKRRLFILNIFFVIIWSITLSSCCCFMDSLLKILYVEICLSKIIHFLCLYNLYPY